jgi:hypothetical protein
MTLFLARPEPGVPGPLPAPGSPVWVENLRPGPLATLAGESRGDRLRLETPRLGGAEVVPPAGAPLRITYSVQVPCEARGAAVAPGPGDAAGVWMRVAAVDRIQRRGAVRVPVQLIARLGGGADGHDLESGITEDLSANGVLMRLVSPLAVGTTTNLVVHCGGDAGDLRVPARVVRVDHDPESVRPYRVALAFPDLDRPTEARLVRYLFERLRGLRRRELGE